MMINPHTDLLSQLVSRYARAQQKAVQRGQITPHEAAVLLDAYGESH